jgi:hypothetical protein
VGTHGLTIALLGLFLVWLWSLGLLQGSRLIVALVVFVGTLQDASLAWM